MAIAYLNGTWCQPEEAKVSVFDRGFMFGDGVYEVMAIYGDQVFTLDAHLDRLERSLSSIQLQSPYTRAQWRELLNEAVARSDEDPAIAYLQITRGVSDRRSLAFDEAMTPTVLITVTEAPILTRESVRPYKMAIREDFRWGRGDVKVVSLVAASMIKNEVVKAGFDDAILVRDGKVTEATASNVFIAKDGVIKTPPISNHLLPGITRDHVVSLIKEAGMELLETEFGVAEILAADEVWISSTGHEVWPVGQVDDHIVGNGSAGVIWQSVDALYQKSKKTG